jgi:hypothetical protein
MKITVVSAIICALLMFGAERAKADELQELKQQLNMMQKRIEELEKAQVEQGKKTDTVATSVEKIKKQPSASEVVSEALSKKTTVSGHFKFYLADQSDGEVNGIDQHNSFAAGISNLWLYFNKQLNDWIQIEVAPELMVEAAATPSLGANIRRDKSADVEVDLAWAYLAMRLPWGFEAKAGALFPYFSEEYASKVWWDEQYNGNNGLLTLENWRSTGIELYRNFEFDVSSLSVSLPVYLYPYLNGDDRGIIQDKRFTDNNSSKSFLLHVAPEFIAYGARFKLLGSFGMGKWDDDGDNYSRQWAAGADVAYGPVNISGEYLSRWLEDLPVLGGGTKNGEDEGWYIKGNYRINPKWRVILKYSDVDLWFPGTNDLLTDNYKTFGAAVNFFITESSIIMPQFEYVDADRSDGSQSLEYIRYTLGWRTTF